MYKYLYIRIIGSDKMCLRYRVSDIPNYSYRYLHRYKIKLAMLKFMRYQVI